MTYGLDVAQVRALIVRPVLQRLSLWTQAAENLVLGTALYESELRCVLQRPRGPAMGLWQMEPATHHDLYANYLDFDRDMKRELLKLASYFSADYPDPNEMVGNMNYACGLCRIQYLRYPGALPAATDAIALATYYKTAYNTSAGKASIEAALPHFQVAIQVAA